MAVTVRLFAAVREAAGTAELEVDPAPLPALLQGLRARHGAAFAQRLALCTVLLDGSATPQDADVAVPDGAEVVLLPPVSGGATRADPALAAPERLPARRRAGRTLPTHMTRVVVASGLAVVGLGALLAGPTGFTVFILAVAVAVLVDLSILLGRAGARPVLPVALVPGVVLPALIARDVAADPAAGWDRVPGAFAVAFLLAFLLVLVFGRRAGVVMGLAATATASLLVGVGASALVGLRGLPSGLTWVLALGVLVVAADVAAPVVRRIRARSGGSRPLRGAGDAVATPVAALLPPLVAVALVGLVLGLLIGPPLDPLVLVLLGLIALVAALAGGYLERGLAREAEVPARRIGTRVGEGLLLGPVDALLIAAPAAYVLARSLAL